jgi:hypothetical protein
MWLNSSSTRADAEGVNEGAKPNTEKPVGLGRPADGCTRLKSTSVWRPASGTRSSAKWISCEAV